MRLVEQSLHLRTDALGQQAASLATRLHRIGGLRRLDGFADGDHHAPRPRQPGAGRHGLLGAGHADGDHPSPRGGRQVGAAVVHAVDGGSGAARPLGEDQQHLAARQQRLRRLQRHPVQLVALYGEGADAGGEPAADRSPEHGLLGEGAQPPRAVPGDEGHIQVGAVDRRQDGRSGGAQVLLPAHVDAEVEQACQEPDVPAGPVDPRRGPAVGGGEDPPVQPSRGGDAHGWTPERPFERTGTTSPT